MCSCDHLHCVTNEFDKFLNGTENCELYIEAQWVIITLVAIGLLLVLAAIESGILIHQACLLYWKRRCEYQQFLESTGGVRVLELNEDTSAMCKSGSDVISLHQITKQQTDIPAQNQINESVGESRQVPMSSASLAVTYSTTQDPSLYDRLADASLTMEQEKSLVTTGAHNESETTALLVHIDAPSHTTQTATTTTTTATSAVEARVTTM